TAIAGTRSGITYDTKLSVARMTLQAADDSDALVQQIMSDPTRIKGATVIIRRTYLDLDPASVLSYRVLFKGRITQVTGNPAGIISLEVSDQYFHWQGNIVRRNTSKLCGFRFKGTRCGYTGAGTFCDKTLTACQGYNNEDNFGGFPYTARLQFRNVRIE
ncbi:MAG: hypothetical protein HGA78_04270, partial [Nitrospirales bacterium]|nr:hypothetical protein [Nitrospirales bacterium]